MKALNFKLGESLTLLICVLLLIFVSSCSKDPCARLDGDWDLQSWTVNGVPKVYDFGLGPELVYSGAMEFTPDEDGRGEFEFYVNGYLFGGGAYICNEDGDEIDLGAEWDLDLDGDELTLRLSGDKIEFERD